MDSAIRDFALRFGVDLGVAPNHIKVLDNPINQWNATAMKSLIVAMLHAIQEIPLEKENPQRPPNPDQKQLANKGTLTASEKEAVDSATDSLKKANGDTPEFWKQVFELLVELGDATEGQYAGDDFEDGETRVFLVQKLMHVAVTSPVIRENIDNDLETGLKAIKRKTWDEIKAERERMLKPVLDQLLIENMNKKLTYISNRLRNQEENPRGSQASRQRQPHPHCQADL